LTVGMVVFHDLSDTSTVFQKVDLPATADLSAMAGVVMAASVTTLYYCWVQCLGYNASAMVSVATSTGTIAAGDYLKGVNSTTIAIATLDAATQPAYSRNLQALEAKAVMTTPASAAIGVMVNCL